MRYNLFYQMMPLEESISKEMKLENLKLDAGAKEK